MAIEPAANAATIDLTSQQLLCQLYEEVGYLRGVIQSIDTNSDDDELNEILVAALRHHDQLSAIRRCYRITVGSEVAV